MTSQLSFEARLARLEAMSETLRHVLIVSAKQPDLPVAEALRVAERNRTEEAAAEPQQEISQEPIAEPDRKIVIPDGYELPTPDTAMELYAEAVIQLERHTKLNHQVAENWKSLVINPGTPIKLAMALLPLLDAIVEDAGPQLAIDVPRVSVDRHLARIAQALAKSTTAESVAMGEFIDKAFLVIGRDAEAGDESCSKIMSNLRTLGLVR